MKTEMQMKNTWHYTLEMQRLTMEPNMQSRRFGFTQHHLRGRYTPFRFPLLLVPSSPWWVSQAQSHSEQCARVPAEPAPVPETEHCLPGVLQVHVPVSSWLQEKHYVRISEQKQPYKKVFVSESEVAQLT